MGETLRLLAKIILKKRFFNILDTRKRIIKNANNWVIGALTRSNNPSLLATLCITSRGFCLQFSFRD